LARRAAPLLAGALVSALLATTAMAQATGSYELDVAAGKSQVLETPGPYTDVMIGDAKVADVVPLTRHSVYVVGKSIGSTSLSIYGPGKRLMAAVNVVVEPDIQTLQSRLRQLVPDEKDVAIHSSNGSLILSGTVTSPAALHQIDELAETLDPGKVVNMLGVEGTQQVQLEVRFVEMERTVAKALSINVNRTSVSGNPQFQFSSGGQSLGGVAGTPGFAALSFLTPDGNLTVALDALEAKGVVKTLAEPTLVAMSGDTASFLAGGEIPIPAPQVTGTGAAVITVTYQEFGISLAFTPTILRDGMINLVVKPEVSNLDPAFNVNASGFTIPGLKVRRASTTVELRDGESFTIAGLLSDNYQNAVNAFPLLGDIPVLGTLFRSPNFQSDQTELVIVVTPHLVTARRGPVALPTDHFTPPSDYELFLFGMLAGEGAQVRPEDRALMSQDPAKGGVDGPYGHVLY
jgi:pilus assembly protein CpaC